MEFMEVDGSNVLIDLKKTLRLGEYLESIYRVDANDLNNTN